MQNSNRPTRFTLPFAQNDSSRVEIPVTTADATRASLSLGFPPLTMTPPEAGGVPPQGEDFNGAMNQIARAVRWVVAGTFWPYDATFSGDTNVGGYPQGSIVQNSTFTGWLGSRVENNTTNPTAGQSGNWGPLTNAGYEIAMASGTAASLSLTDEQAASGYVRLTGTVFRNTSIVLPTTTGLNFSFIHDAANDTTAPTAVISVVDGYSNSVPVYPGQRVNFRTRNDGQLVAVSTGAAPNQFSSLQTVSGATTLPTTYAGALVLLTGATNYTVTLPLASTFAPGAPIDFLAETSANVTVTIARQGTSDTITGSGTVSGRTSLVMYNGDKLTLVSDGTKWHAQDGTAAMQFAQSQNNVKTVSAATTLDGSYGRVTTVATGSSPYTITMHAASSVQPGTPYNFLSINSSTTTISRAGSDVLVANNANQALSSLVLNSGDTAQIVSDGVSKWYLVDGSAQGNYAAGLAGKLINIRVFTAGGTYTATTGTNSVVVEGVGAGGAGGGAPAAGSGNITVGAGGGAGAYGWVRLTSGFNGQTITIGTGGSGVAGGTGGSGGTTSFGTSLVLAGGTGGGTGVIVSSSGLGGQPGSGGAATTATVGVPGSSGFTGLAISASIGQSGAGGSTRFGAGGGATQGGGPTASSGFAGTGYGAGGSGGLGISNTVTPTGGAGAPGLIVVYEYA